MKKYLFLFLLSLCQANAELVELGPKDGSVLIDRDLILSVQEIPDEKFYWLGNEGYPEGFYDINSEPYFRSVSVARGFRLAKQQQENRIFATKRDGRRAIKTLIETKPRVLIKMKSKSLQGSANGGGNILIASGSASVRNSSDFIVLFSDMSLIKEQLKQKE